MSLLLLIAAGGKRLVTETFYANATWVCPATTFRLESITGKGTDGTPGSSYSSSTGTAFAGLHNLSSGPGNTSGTANWSQIKAYADVAFNAINNGSATNYGSCTIAQFTSPSPTYTISPGGVSNIGGTPVPGSAYYLYQGSATSSGLITGTGHITIQFEIGTASTNGSSSSGFGQTFPGGIGAPPAPVTYVASSTNLATVPGNSYTMTIFSGGYITISYLR